MTGQVSFEVLVVFALLLAVLGMLMPVYTSVRDALFGKLKEKMILFSLAVLEDGIRVCKALAPGSEVYVRVIPMEGDAVCGPEVSVVFGGKVYKGGEVCVGRVEGSSGVIRMENLSGTCYLK